MFEWLKHHFFPHEGNDYQPHFLRRKIAGLLLLLLLVIEIPYLASSLFLLPQSDYFAAVLAAVLVDQTNVKRAEDKLTTLSVSQKLVLAAQMKADDMAAKGYFSHNTPDGKTPWFWFEKAGYNYAAAGENLAVNFTDSKDVTEAWMRSPTHRANIMSGNYTETGIATAHGVYKGKNAIFVVQEFGRPSLIAREIERASTTASAIGAVSQTAVQKVVSTVTRIPTTQAPTMPIPTKATPPLTASVPIELPPVSPTSTVVAGAETQKLDAPIDLTTNSQVAASVIPSKLKTLITSPRHVTTAIYVTLALIILVALLLAIFVKVRLQFPHLIVNGVLLLALVSTFIILNSVTGFMQGVI